MLNKKMPFEYLVNIWDTKIKNLKASKVKELMNNIFHYKLDKTLVSNELSSDINLIFNEVKKVIDDYENKKIEISSINKRNALARWKVKKELISNNILFNLKEKVIPKEKYINTNNINNIYNNNINNNKEKEKEINNKEKEKEINNKDFSFKNFAELSFEKYFWDLYPKKVNKQDALKQWKILFKKIKFNSNKCYSLLEEIIIGLKYWLKYEKSWQDKTCQYVMHPAKWLRNKNWESKFNTLNSNEIVNPWLNYEISIPKVIDEFL